MRYLALATDYDNTLATEGRVADATRAVHRGARRRGVQPLEIGKVNVATHAPQETLVLETIRHLRGRVELVSKA